MAKEQADIAYLYTTILASASMTWIYPESSDIWELQDMSYTVNQDKTWFEIRWFWLDKISWTSDDVVKSQNF